MRRFLFFTFICIVLWSLVSCSTAGKKGTIGSLRNKRIEIKEEKIEGGLEKAMQSYQRFVEESPESSLTPEAIRRLADLKLEKEYGTLTPGLESSALPSKPAEPDVPKAPMINSSITNAKPGQAQTNIPAHGESQSDFEKRTTQMQPVESTAVSGAPLPEAPVDLERAGAREAIRLYEKLLKDYPQYERNDQVLYQMSRAYEELGEVDKAMKVMNQMVRDVPNSRYIDEVQFRRAEYFFVRKRYLDAEDAYASIVKIGVSSTFFELAMYKLGWTFYKQELYEEALDRFVALLDHKVTIGYDFDQTKDETEQKRIEDTFRVISLSFSNVGGADSVVKYFETNGKRIYEDKVYGNLGEFYYNKRRYADAAATYNAFVERNPFHKVSPNYHMRVIEILAAGGFPSLVLESKKKFATTYRLEAEYWQYFDPDKRPDVLKLLKTNLTDLANHFHACYQDKRQAKDKTANFNEARHWYVEYLTMFPKETESSTMNFQFANLLVEHKWYGPAAREFEKTAYDYPPHKNSSKAGYAAIAAYRAQLKAAKPETVDAVKRETIRSSLKFADTFPKHEKAAIILGAAVDDLYEMKEYEQTIFAAKKLVQGFPNADLEVFRGGWLVIGHASYELTRFSEAEAAYLKVLELLPKQDKTRSTIIDNLAASIYKQGEEANKVEDYRTAVNHFLRIGTMAPTSKIRPTAEYDAATALIQLKDWPMAATVLVGFRTGFPQNSLQHEVTKKLAFVYQENKQYALAADEYERIETESQDEAIRMEALQLAAELHEKAGNMAQVLVVYRRYVDYFPEPIEPHLETRSKIAELLKKDNKQKEYVTELRTIVKIEAAAGKEQTPQTRYIAGQAALVLAEMDYDVFLTVKLVKPFKVNLKKKQKLMKRVIQKFNQLMDYEVGETTAASTFYLAEINAHFSKSLMKSERPEGLSDLELEQYELLIEEQAYPFEEQAIEIHESNLNLISKGIYNKWVDKSLQKLAVFFPARYNKPEEPSGILSSPDTFIFAIENPTPPVIQNMQTANTEKIEAAESGRPETSEVEEVPESSEEVVQDEIAAAQGETGTSESTPPENAANEQKTEKAESVQVETSKAEKTQDRAEPSQAAPPETVKKPAPSEIEKKETSIAEKDTEKSESTPPENAANEKKTENSESVQMETSEAKKEQNPTEPAQTEPAPVIDSLEKSEST